METVSETSDTKMPAHGGNRARARHRKKAPRMTVDSLHQMPRLARWAIYAFAALTVTGVLPMAVAAGVGCLIEAFGTPFLALLLAAAAAFVAWALSW